MSGNGNGHGDGEIDIRAVYGLLQTMAGQFIVMQRDMLTMQRTMQAEFTAIRVELAKKADKADLESLRHDVNMFHASVIGHGINITEHDERLTRLEAARP